MKTLLHICCGPCATYCVDALRADGHEVMGYNYNPNIHPLREYRLRAESVKKFAAEVDLPLIGHPEYGMQDFLRQVTFRENERCLICYNMRLTATAKMAKHGNFEAFTTTLLISPFQNREQIIAIGQRLAEEYAIKFLDYDFRPGFKTSVQLSKDMELYRQQYCGCIYSEEERYRNVKSTNL